MFFFFWLNNIQSHLHSEILFLAELVSDFRIRAREGGTERRFLGQSNRASAKFCRLLCHMHIIYYASFAVFVVVVDAFFLLICEDFIHSCADDHSFSTPTALRLVEL